METISNLNLIWKTGATAMIKTSQSSTTQCKPPPLSRPQLTNWHLSAQLLMSNKKPNATPTAVHAMRLMANKESTPRESDTSASMVISKSLKTSPTTNWAKPSKPQKDSHTRTPNVFLTTTDRKSPQISVLKALLHAQMVMKVSELEPPLESDQHEIDIYIEVISLLLTLLTNPYFHKLFSFILIPII